LETDRDGHGPSGDWADKMLAAHQLASNSPHHVPTDGQLSIRPGERKEQIAARLNQTGITVTGKWP